MSRKVLLLCSLIFSVRFLAAQVVYSDPQYATERDSIVIYFDATQGNAGLLNYTGDVYAHTGVITNLSTQPSDWHYVVTPWPGGSGTANTSKNKLVRITTNLYKLTIGYPRIYYVSHENSATIPPNEKILQLAFVFRNADGSKTGRDIGGTDIFHTLYEPGLTVIISEPSVDLSFSDSHRSPIFTSCGDTVNIKIETAALGTEVDTLKLYVDEQLKNIVTDSVMSYAFLTAGCSYGMKNISVIGTDTTGISDTASFAIMINPPVTYESRPESVQDGINILDDHNVVLSLMAPHKEFVYVLGDFNDWLVDTSFYMLCDDKGGNDVHWWLNIGDLDPAEEYAFQYLVDGQIRIADPYSEKILDPWNDQYIPMSVYPDLKPYPAGKTKEITGVFQTFPSTYTWINQDFTKPAKTNLVIYELLIRDFIDDHCYQTLTDTLDYLQNLGINAIELMPISEFEGNSSWGYNPSFYFAPDKYYGTADALKHFIDECHARGIAVIQDIVLNHSYGSSPLVRLYWDDTNSRPSAENPWYNQTSPNTSYSWGSDFNHESEDTKYFVDRVTAYWLTNFRIDGFRFDFTKGFTNKPGDGSAYDAGRIAILKRMADRIWSVDSTAYVILEHFADNSEEKILADYGMLLWGNSNWNYAQSAMGYTSESSFSWGFYKSRSWSLPGLVTYMESHDEERLMYKNLQWGNASGSYNIKNLQTALNRIKLNAAFFLTLPGPKMIWQFGELGYDISIENPCRICEKPLLWDYFQQADRLNLYKTYAALLKLRFENSIFTSPNTTPIMSLNSNIKMIAMSGSPNTIIIGNFGVTSIENATSFQHGGWWFDYFSGDSIYVSGSTYSEQLAPGEFHIYTDRKLPTPEQGILSSIKITDNTAPSTFKIHPNYPNPFNSVTSFEYDLEKSSDVKLRIVDLLGREIYSEKVGQQAPGTYRFTWNGHNKTGADAQSGIYFVIVQRVGSTLILKMTLLK
ncbi:MAG: alpha-amylase family glycosyl hydrolase [Candidatus Neomarinimicrobiota bacterium]